jgi:hypothetical protein
MLYEPVSNAGTESKQKMDYEYNGDHLLREIHSVYYFNGPWEIENKKEYYYMNNKVDSIIEYIPTGTNIWKKTGKLEFEYSGDQITKLVHFSYSSNTYIQDKNTPYNYIDGHIISIGSDNSLINFQYDERGKLIFCNDGNYLMPERTFQYETGTGNYAYLQYLSDPLSEFEQYPATICIP